MDALRLILLCIAAVVLATLYTFGRRSMDTKTKPDKLSAQQPIWSDYFDDTNSPTWNVDEELDSDLNTLGQAIQIDSPATEQHRANRYNNQQHRSGHSSRARPPQDFLPLDRKIMVLYLYAGKDHAFHGNDLFQTAEEAGLSFDEAKGVFTYAHLSEHGKVPIFGMAKMLEPGYFDRSTLAAEFVPGVVFYMQLPCKVGNQKGFDILIETMQHMQHRLGGVFLDASHSNMSRQTIMYLREQIQEYSRQSLFKQPTSRPSLGIRCMARGKSY